MRAVRARKRSAVATVQATLDMGARVVQLNEKEARELLAACALARRAGRLKRQVTHYRKLIASVEQVQPLWNSRPECPFCFGMAANHDADCAAFTPEGKVR